jgi:hypothetical protein
MSTTTASTAPRGALEASPSAVGSLLRRAMAAFLESRRLSAHRHVARHLEGLSDVRLLDLGFSAAEIEAIRAGEPVVDVLAQRARRLA